MSLAFLVNGPGGTGWKEEAAAIVRRAAERFRVECDAGKADACHGLWDVLRYRQVLPRDRETETRAIEKACGLYEALCARGDAEACRSAGQCYNWQYGELSVSDVGRARSFYQRSCDLASIAGCLSLVYALEDSDPARATCVLERVCNAHDAEGCDLLVYAHNAGWFGVALDAKKAHAYALEACDLSHGGWACRFAAHGLSGPHPVETPNPRRAFDLFRQACDGYDGEGCFYAGLFAVELEEPARDLFARACALDPNPYRHCEVAKSHAACEKHDGNGCAALATGYLETGEAPLVPIAVTMLERACDEGTLRACGALGSFLAGPPEGHAARRDEARAVVMLDRACDVDADACQALAKLYDTASTIPRDPTRAAKARERACTREPARCMPVLEYPRP
jgi:TPR repeat protein